MTCRARLGSHYWRFEAWIRQNENNVIWTITSTGNCVSELFTLSDTDATDVMTVLIDITLKENELSLNRYIILIPNLSNQKHDNIKQMNNH